MRAGRSPRGLRLDFFRGLALLFILLNHIPSDLVGWIAFRHHGFSGAAEITGLLRSPGARQSLGERDTFSLWKERCWHRALSSRHS